MVFIVCSVFLSINVLHTQEYEECDNTDPFLFGRDCYDKVAEQFDWLQQQCGEASSTGLNNTRRFLDCMTSNRDYNKALEECSHKYEEHLQKMYDCNARNQPEYNGGKIYYKTGNPLIDEEHEQICKTLVSSYCTPSFIAFRGVSKCNEVKISCDQFLGEEKPEPKCTDSDNSDFYSRNYKEEVYGSIQIPDAVINDWCINDEILVEMGCRNKHIISEFIDCEDEGFDGCVNGACVEDDSFSLDLIDNEWSINTFVDIESKDIKEPKPLPIIGGIDVGHFDQEGNGVIHVFVHNGGDLAGDFSSTVLSCDPFLQTDIPQLTIEPNDTVDIQIGVKLFDLSQTVGRRCKIVVQDNADNQNYTSADADVWFLKDIQQIECAQDSDCNANQFCHTEAQVCVRKNMCKTVLKQANAGNALDIVFVGEEYTSDTALQNDIQYIIDAQGREEHSLFTTPPFNNYRDKIDFSFHFLVYNKNGSFQKAYLRQLFQPV